MAPPDVLLKAAKKPPVQTRVNDFFKVKRGRGRPKKKHLLPHEVAAVLDSASKPSAPKAPPKPPVEAKKKASAPKEAVKKTDWADGGDNEERLASAVDDWLQSKGTALDDNGEKHSLRVFCYGVAKIPYNTFKHYVCKDESKRRIVGNRMGRKPLIDRKSGEFVVDILVRADRGNNGSTPAEMIDQVVELKPDLTRKQASRAMYRTILPGNKKKIRPKSRLAQATCTNRTNINVSQQYRSLKL
jgi:hypothetical protein